MSEKPKLPPYIKALNIAMIIVLLAICGLVAALTWKSKDLGWSLPSADSETSYSSSLTSSEEQEPV